MRRNRGLLVLALVGCRTQLPDFSDGGAQDFAAAAVSDLASDDAVCAPPDDGAVAGCPCGTAGLCRAASGRLSVQTQAQNGTLRIEVMDDNGCRRFPVAAEHPIGVPRWAPDRERLAYITGGGGGQLHVIRVAASGDVTCRASEHIGLAASEVAWASDDEVWLFAPGQLARWRLGQGIVATVPLPNAAQFDAIGDGPLAVVLASCGNGCPSQVAWRPSVASGDLIVSLLEPMRKIGPVRLDPAGKRIAFELDGVTLTFIGSGEPPPPLHFGAAGDRSPAFALGGGAVVYTTDDGQLRYHLLDGENTEEAIPPTWKFVYSPDWAPLPRSCSADTHCIN